jgi:hypothetical protein
MCSTTARPSPEAPPVTIAEDSLKLMGFPNARAHFRLMVVFTATATAASSNQRDVMVFVCV